MPSFQVTHSVNINKNKTDVKTILSDFREMAKWSPWLVLEPNATLNYSENQSQVGATQSWVGELIGKGSMELTSIEDSTLHYDLRFEKPFKSTAKVRFELSEEEEQTSVTWVMDGKLPWYLFFLTKVMKVFIGMDYERGLTMLKEYAETGEVTSKLEMIGEGELQEIYYMGLEGESAISEIGEVMQKDFDTLGAYVEEHNLSKDAKVFAIYNTFDFMKGRTSFVSCVSIEKDYEVPAPCVKGKVEHSNVFNIRHTGKYQHLGNAWSLLMNHTRFNKMSIQTKPFGYEFYLNSPHETPEEELITDVMVRLK
jgi:DNA gyrase inhibitor GyrI